MNTAFEYGDTEEERAADDGYRGAMIAGANYSRTMLDQWLSNVRMGGPSRDPVREARRLGVMDGIEALIAGEPNPYTRKEEV